jgi:uncharacterized protein with HEPN domain
LVRNLEILGEAAKHIPKRVKEKYPDVDWKAMAGMRNILERVKGVDILILDKFLKPHTP